jgi:hypothetical protein
MALYRQTTGIGAGKKDTTKSVRLSLHPSRAFCCPKSALFGEAPESEKTAENTGFSAVLSFP